MTPEEVRAAACHLSELHRRFAPLFGYQPAQEHALVYRRGLLLQEGRKNTEAIALYSGRGPRPKSPVRDGVRSVQVVAESLPAESWRVLCLREGSGDPVAFEFAAVRVGALRDQKPGPPIWLLIRRPVGGVGEVKYYVSNAPE